jgi:hypothetical protein
MTFRRSNAAPYHNLNRITHLPLTLNPRYLHLSSMHATPDLEYKCCSLALPIRVPPSKGTHSPHIRQSLYDLTSIPNSRWRGADLSQTWYIHAVNLSTI